MVASTSFKKVVVCHTNDFKPEINEKIKTWVEANGARFSKELTVDVTHLVASRKAWKRYIPLVKQARRTRTVSIVSFDWLEASLLSKPIKAVAVDKYLYEQSQVQLRQCRQKRPKDMAKDTHKSAKRIIVPREKMIETSGESFEGASRDFEQDMECVGFHPYADETSFVYIVTLLRRDVIRKCFEKYKLKLYESDQRPHTYAAYVQYTRPRVSRQVLTLAKPGVTWQDAWSAFTAFFHQKVGAVWNKRSANGVEFNLDEDNAGRYFQYQAPKIGQPEGLRVSDGPTNVFDLSTRPRDCNYGTSSR